MNEKESLLDQIKAIDLNGWCGCTDGTLEEESQTIEDQIEALRETLAYIIENN